MDGNADRSTVGTADGVDLTHQALFYRDLDEFVVMTADVIGTALAAGEPVLAALPVGHLEPVRAAVNADAGRVRWVDMTTAGRNPGRILPGVLTAFQAEHGPGPVTMIGEPIWPGRTPGEYAAAVSHEALINLAFARRAVTVVCPYDVTGLGSAALRDAERTHPELVDGDGVSDSSGYDDPASVAADAARKITPPPADARAFTVQSADELFAARLLVSYEADLAGLPGDRATRFVLACHEALANALRHGGGRADLRIWQHSGELVCEVASPGPFTDPLAGRRSPSPGSSGGRGLVLINEVCDLVQLSATAHGTTIQLHASLDSLD